MSAFESLSDALNRTNSYNHNLEDFDIENISIEEDLKYMDLLPQDVLAEQDFEDQINKLENFIKICEESLTNDSIDLESVMAYIGETEDICEIFNISLEDFSNLTEDHIFDMWHIKENAEENYYEKLLETSLLEFEDISLEASEAGLSKILERAKASLTQLDKQISELKNKASGNTPSQKSKIEKEISTLQRQRNKANTKIQNAEKALSDFRIANGIKASSTPEVSKYKPNHLIARERRAQSLNAEERNYKRLIESNDRRVNAKQAEYSKLKNSKTATKSQIDNALNSLNTAKNRGKEYRETLKGIITEKTSLQREINSLNKDRKARALNEAKTASKPKAKAASTGSGAKALSGAIASTTKGAAAAKSAAAAAAAKAASGAASGPRVKAASGAKAAGGAKAKADFGKASAKINDALKEAMDTVDNALKTAKRANLIKGGIIAGAAAVGTFAVFKLIQAIQKNSVTKMNSQIQRLKAVQVGAISQAGLNVKVAALSMSDYRKEVGNVKKCFLDLANISSKVHSASFSSVMSSLNSSLSKCNISVSSSGKLSKTKSNKSNMSKGTLSGKGYNSTSAKAIISMNEDLVRTMDNAGNKIRINYEAKKGSKSSDAGRSARVINKAYKSLVSHANAKCVGNANRVIRALKKAS